MTATILSTLDMTIANVALPHMQGSLSASQEQMTWVLTSYIVAAAMTMPLSGWLASTLGRRTLLLGSITGFVIASALCGIAQNLTQIVLFRALQGVFGAALVPISQALMLDVNPPDKQGSAMAWWTAGALLGPTAGPIVGGWLTDAFDWRWVFYINVPIGIGTIIGLWMFMPQRPRETVRLDLFGFGLLALSIGLFQLMLDRGQQMGWFDSLEIQIEALAAGLCLYLFIAHSATTKRPFIPRAVLRDRNFALGAVLTVIFAIVMFSSLSLAPSMQQHLLGYPVLTSGIYTAPRGLASLVATFAAVPLAKRFDARWLIASGFLMFSIGTWMLTRISLDTDPTPLIIAAVIQGFAAQLAFVPLAVACFATLDRSLGNEAAALSSVLRNVGSSAGISITHAVLVTNSAVVHSRLMEAVRVDNPAVLRLPEIMNPLDPAGAMRIEAMIARQSTMIAYLGDYHLLAWLALCGAPIAFLLKRPAKADRIEIVVE